MEAIVAKVVEVLSQPTVIGTVAVILEFALRFIKSEKPISIAHLIASALAQLAIGAKALADFLDKVLPQKVVAAPAPTEPPQA